MAKYLNSNDTELFHKGDVLYNFSRARKAMQGANGATTVIAVEGYMDVIALHQAGIGNAVAPLGTALTENQLGLLWKMTPEPVLCFDGDGVRVSARPIARPIWRCRCSGRANRCPSRCFRMARTRTTSSSMTGARPSIVSWRRRSPWRR